MTPEEQATELLQRCKEAIVQCSFEGEIDADEMAKESALIAVDVAMNEARKIAKIMYEVADQNPFDRSIIYWQKVKQIIEKP